MATPSGVHPRICCRTRSIFQGGIPSSRARSAGRPPRADDSFPIARTPWASALVIMTGATPVDNDHRNASSASAARPSTARSATVKLEASARPV